MIANSYRKLKNYTGDVLEQLLTRGWLQTGRWLAQTLVSIPYRRIEYDVFGRSLQSPLPDLTPRLPVDLRPASLADLPRFEGLRPSSKQRHFDRRLTHGRHCFLALDGEDLAAYCWATTRVEFDVDNLEMSLQPGDAYVDDAYTVPAYRRQGIQSALHVYRLGYMRKLGCRRAVLIVENTNVASQGLVRKLGYRQIDRLSFRRLLWQRSYHYHQGKF